MDIFPHVLNAVCVLTRAPCRIFTDNLATSTGNGKLDEDAYGVFSSAGNTVKCRMVIVRMNTI